MITILLSDRNIIILLIMIKLFIIMTVKISYCMHASDNNYYFYNFWSDHYNINHQTLAFNVPLGKFYSSSTTTPQNKLCNSYVIFGDY